MKASILIHPKYSLSRIVEQILQKVDYETTQLDFRGIVSAFESKVNTQIYRLPYMYRQKWSNYYLRKINKWYITQFAQEKPDLVFVYNNEMLLPETLQWLKGEKTKIVFFLGDNPLYTHTSPYNLTVLDYADAVFVPDTFWQFQLQKIGLKNVHHLLFPLPDDDYYPVNISEIDANFKALHKADVFYAGMCYNDSWGYKKAKFLNNFSKFNLKIYGNKAWKKWLPFFPELENHYKETNGYIPTPELNNMFNLAKIIPVDGNPGIFNGIHLRALEALSAGALPLMEYNKDMDFIFEGVNDLPAVKDYREISEMAKWYVGNDKVRNEKVEEMRKTYVEKYNIEGVAETFLKYIP